MDASVISSSPVDRRLRIPVWLTIAVLFALGATGSALRKPVTQGFDEVAHISYIAHLQTTGEKWPRLATLRMLDPTTFHFTSVPNYLNHPPLYYWLMAVAAPGITDHPSSLIPVRLLNVAMVALGLTALLMLGGRMQAEGSAFYAFAAMVGATPVLAPLAGAANNDNLAFLGGALSILGLYAYASSFSRSWLILACCGMIAGSAAKLTGLILVGSAATMTIALLAIRHGLSKLDLSIFAASVLLAASSYLVLMAQYGSPAPDTAAQSELLRSGAEAAGWAHEPRMAPAAYVLFFLKSFLMDWMPVLRPRSIFQLALLALPAAILVIAVAGWFVSIRSLLRNRQQPSDFLVVAGMASIVLTLAVHIAFSYQRHLQTGWAMDAYPRYYLPLIAIVPIAALTFTTAIQSERVRGLFFCFLIGAPIVFQMFGAPMG